MQVNVAAVVEDHAVRHPGRIALTFEQEAYSYADVEIRAAQAAHVFAGLGVGPGDRVAIQLPNIPAYVWCYLGALKLGAIVVALNPALTAAEFRFVVGDSSPTLLVNTTGALAGQGRRIGEPRHVLVAGDGRFGSLESAMARVPSEHPAVRVPPDTPAAILYTSGTTGTPKGATLSHGNILFVAAAKERCLGLSGSDRLLLSVPLFHCFGQNAILNAGFQAGATVCLERRFDAGGIGSTVRTQGITVLCAVPAGFALMMDAPVADFASVRLFLSAAAPLPRDLEARWQRRFDRPVLQGYGLTETSPFASYNHLTAYRPGSIGTAIEGTEMRVVDLVTGAALPPGSSGEIVVRGPNVMLGYWNQPDETAATVQGGWCHTGDIGRVDADGYFFYEDRLKDIVIVGGFNVYPAEVENVLLQHAGVRDAAVHGVPDAVLGERVRAVIVLRDPLIDAAALMAFCRQRLAPTKVPSEIAFAAALPRSPAGKVLKRALRESYVPPLAFDGVRAGSAATLEQQLVAWLAARLESGTVIDPDTSFADLGLTSMLAVELAAAVAGWTGRHIPATAAWSHTSVRTLVRHVVGMRPSERAPSTSGALEHLSDAEAEALLLRELARIKRGHRP